MKVALSYGRVIDLPPKAAEVAKCDAVNAHIAKLNLHMAAYRLDGYGLDYMVNEWVDKECQVIAWDQHARDETEMERLGLLPVN